MTDRELERLLLRAAASTRYPTTPNLAAGVLARISGGAPWAGLAFQPRPAPALIVVAALLLSLAFALAVSPGRDAIARFFGVEGLRIERLPAAPPEVSPTPAPGPDGLETIARPVTLAEAQAAAGFVPGLPAAGSEQPQAFLLHYGSQAVIILRYEAFDLWQARLEQRAFFGKGIPPGGVLREVEVRGQPAVWLTGGPHFASYVLPDGQALRDSERTVERSTLIWRTTRAFYRLETDLPLQQALRIAETLP